MRHRKLIEIAFIVLLVSFASDSFGDSAGPPEEELHKSPNGMYYLHLVPKGDWLEEGYYIEWTYGRTNGPVYFRRKGFYPTDVQISDNGERFVVAGNYVHNSGSKDEDEGLWFYDRQGKLIRHINRPRCYFPVHSVSSIWWFEEAKINPEKGTYSLIEKDGSTRTYDLKDGKLTWFLPSVIFFIYYGTIAVYAIFIIYILLRLGRLILLKRKQIALKHFRDAIYKIKPVVFKTIVSSLLCSTIVFVCILFLSYAIMNPAALHPFRFAYEEALPQAITFLITGVFFFAIRRELILLRSLIAIFALIILNYFFVLHSTGLEAFTLMPYTASLILLLPIRSSRKTALHSTST